MNKDTNTNRRRDIVTPAQRNAEREKRLMEERKAAEQKSIAEKKAAEEARRAQEAKKAQIEAMRRSSVKSPAERNGTVQKAPQASAQRPAQKPVSAPRPPSHVAQKPSATPPAKSEITAEQQRILREKQREIAIMEKKLREEQEKKAAEVARVKRLTELQHSIDKQKIIREELIAKDMKSENSEKKKILSVVIFGVIAVLVVLNIVVFSMFTKKDIPPKSPEAATDNKAPDSSSASENSPEEVIPEIIPDPTDKFTINASDYVNGTLVLVNSDYIYDFENKGKDIVDDELVTVATSIKNKIFKASNYKVFLNSEVMDMLNLMMADFYAYSSKTDVMVNTAHRTYEQQLEILEAKKKQLGADQKIAQTPGNSEHHTGYAFDLAIYPANENGSTFINAGAYTWIYENCHKYGFILRYPEGKTAITGIEPESWHFRYVGVPHASYMYNNGKTLEEYITSISIYTEDIPLTINVSEEETYNVFYVKNDGNETVTFSVPADTEYKISGDNVGGFVVWYNNADVGQKGKIPTPALHDASVSEENESETENSGSSDTQQ